MFQDEGSKPRLNCSEEEEKNFPGLMDSLENRFGAGFPKPLGAKRGAQGISRAPIGDYSAYRFSSFFKCSVLLK